MDCLSSKSYIISYLNLYIPIIGKSHTQRDTCRHSPPVDPEGNPRQHDHQHGWKVGLEHEEKDVPPQNEVDVEPIVPT